jgi:arginyl-tRNA synthetase
VNFGAVKGMSTREGNVQFLDDILQECATAMHEVMQRNEENYAQVKEPEKVADTLGISAVMAQDMSGKRVNGYPLDISRMTSFEGDTGPYLQYAHARLCSVARKAGCDRQDVENANTSLLKEPHAVDLIRLLAQYPDTVGHALKTLEPTTILTYLFRFTHQLSSSYDVLRVMERRKGGTLPWPTWRFMGQLARF